MCGIYGKFKFQGELDLGNSLEALTLLEHRGPDGYGFEFGSHSKFQHTVYHNRIPESYPPESSNYFFGHRRLSIVDLNENAFQPMVDNSDRFSITFNGEIYNHIELREELTALGYTFKTAHSDTEVLLMSYVAWGFDCIKKLRGMFAFAIYDRNNANIFIGRDRIGQKTIYYDLTTDNFTFASELPPIIHSSAPRKINKVGLNAYLALGYIPHPYSIFKGIQKLPPATYGIINLKNKKLSLHQYWDIDLKRKPSTDNSDYMSASKKALSESVKLRLRADVSVGAFISGGIDSTLIVKYIGEIGDRKFDIYGADFPDTNRSEKKYIIEAAQRYKQNLHLSAIDLDKTSNIEAIIKVFDEPFDGASSIALFDLFKEASKKHKVILTGDGGDEMFAGYTRYIAFPKQKKLIDCLKFLALPKIISGFLLKCGLKNQKISSLHSLLSRNFAETYFGIKGPSDLTRLLKQENHIDKLIDIESFSALKSVVENSAISLVKKLQYLELKTILPGRMLYKLDRFSMSYGVEARSPFLDHPLVEMAFTIPDRENIENNVTKVILKNILLEDFSKDFVHREKQGFGNPLSNWFRSTAHSGTFAILLNEKSYIYKYLNYNALHQYFPEIKSGYKEEREKDLWRLLVIAHFLEINKAYFEFPKENTTEHSEDKSS